MMVQVNGRYLCLYADALSRSDPIHMAGSRDTGKLVTESVAKSLKAALQGVLALLSLPGQHELKDNVNTVTKSTDVTPMPTTS